MSDDNKPTNYRHIASVVASYWVISISMVYLNKIILSGEGASVPAPLFVTWFQCVITCGICYLLGEIGSRSSEIGRPSFAEGYPRVSYTFETGSKVIKLSLIFVAMVTFNNLCLQYVQVSFYNVARCLSIVFNVIFTYLILKKQTSLNTSMTLLVVIFGFYIGIEGELDFSLIGTVSGVLSSVFVSLNGIYTKQALDTVGGNNKLLLFYNNANACFLFLPLILYFESGVLLENLHVLANPLFWLSMVVCGVCGFAIGLVTTMQIQATSPLTHNISGTAKAAVQVCITFY